MSLTKKRTLTEKRITANQENGKRSRGPATPEGRERIREANLQHGFYAQDRNRALRALGEKPEEFDAVVKAVMEKWPPANGFEELVAMSLVRALWGMERGHRMQEGYALRQAKDVNNRREDRLHALMMRLKTTAGSLQSLAQSVGREHYVTTPADLELMKSLQQEGAVKEMGEIALALFYQLQGPGQHAEDGSPLDGQETSRRALRKFKEIFGLNDPEPAANALPDSTPPQKSQPGAGANQAAVAPASRLTPAEWEAREPVRQLLAHILMRQVEICEAQRHATLKESLAGPSPYERAAEIAPAHPNAVLMRRMEDSSFRQVWRITNLLLKIKRQARESEREENSAQPLKVHENTIA